MSINLRSSNTALAVDANANDDDNASAAVSVAGFVNCSAHMTLSVEKGRITNKLNKPFISEPYYQKTIGAILLKTLIVKELFKLKEHALQNTQQ
ncbi:hypothetical protein ACF0H5_005378 [Mactra antiquata]